MTLRFIRIQQLASTPKRHGVLPMSTATIWRKVANGQFPKPTKLGPKITAWDMAEVEAWIAEQRAQHA